MNSGLVAMASAAAPSASTPPTPKYNDPALNAGGALDVIIVAHADGSLRSTPWHVVFDGHSRPGRVSIEVNGAPFDDGPPLHWTKESEPANFAATGEPPTTTPPNAFINALVSSKLLHEGCNEAVFAVGGDKGPRVRTFV